MSIVHYGTATFGSGGAEPYARALRRNESPVLFLHEPRSGELLAAHAMDVARWNAEADLVDLSLLASVTGPVLDVGCGPGRMVRAARDLGLETLGIDVSPTAIDIATDAGLPVLLGSVFDAVPGEGQWHTALLADGNIGIGGDVTRMLARCSELIADAGEIVVEIHPDADHDRIFTGRLVDTQGHESEEFPWAEIGLSAIMRRATALHLDLRQAWRLDDRDFCRLAKR